MENFEYLNKSIKDAEEEIVSKEEKLYTKEEVIELLGNFGMWRLDHPRHSIDNWIKENL